MASEEGENKRISTGMVGGEENAGLSDERENQVRGWGHALIVVVVTFVPALAGRTEQPMYRTIHGQISDRLNGIISIMPVIQ